MASIAPVPTVVSEPRKNRPCKAPTAPIADAAKTAVPPTTTALGSTPRQLLALDASSPKLSIQRFNVSA